MDTHDVPTTKALGKNRQWILDARPAGKLTGKEFRWHEASIPQPSEGQVLVRNLWLSVDPAQRIWMWRDSYIPKIPIGDVMASFAVGQILESRHPTSVHAAVYRREFREAAGENYRCGGLAPIDQPVSRCADQRLLEALAPY